MCAQFLQNGLVRGRRAQDVYPWLEEDASTIQYHLHEKGHRIDLSTCLSTCKLCKLANEMCGCLGSKHNLYFTKAFLNNACDSMKQDTCVFVDYLLPISVTYICIYEMSI